jgi:hypothetical protein
MNFEENWIYIMDIKNFDPLLSNYNYIGISDDPKRRLEKDQDKKCFKPFTYDIINNNPLNREDALTVEAGLILKFKEETGEYNLNIRLSEKRLKRFERIMNDCPICENFNCKLDKKLFNKIYEKNIQKRNEKNREYQKKKYWENPEKAKSKKMEKYWGNPEKERERQRIKYLKYKENYKEKNKIWRELNPEYRKEYYKNNKDKSKEYYKNNKEKRKYYQRCYRKAISIYKKEGINFR